jgi:polysaccharide pyruvyl transferase WcaK-like protein
MPMQRIGIIAESFGTLSDPHKTTSSALMKSSGYNIGNWAFWNATHKLAGPSARLIPGRPNSKDYIDDIDIIIIPAANWLQPRYDFSWLADFIEEMNKPCIMIGLGAQSHNEDIFHPMTEGTLRMLRAVSSRTPYIGVRGEYTYKTCQHHGINNVQVMGCPSLFTNNSPTLGQDISKKWQKHTDGKTIIHATMFPPNVKQAEQWLFEYLSKNDGTSYVVQAPQSFIKPQFREQLHEKDLAFMEKHRHSLREGIEIDELLQILYKKGYLPFSVDSWINYISFFSRAIGTRIHGSVLSLSATTPTICITHDSRTKELCKIMQIPSVPCETISKENTIDELFDQTKFNANTFNENRKVLAQTYKELFTEAGVAMTDHLGKIIGS